jgi:hypothetical protein
MTNLGVISIIIHCIFTHNVTMIFSAIVRMRYRSRASLILKPSNSRDQVNPRPNLLFLEQTNTTVCCTLNKTCPRKMLNWDEGAKSESDLKTIPGHRNHHGVGPKLQGGQDTDRTPRGSQRTRFRNHRHRQKSQNRREWSFTICVHQRMGRWRRTGMSVRIASHMTPLQYVTA